MDTFNIYTITATILSIIILVLKFTNRRTHRKYSSNDVIIITGCDTGIGLALANHMVKTYRVNVLACVLSIEDKLGNVKSIELSKLNPDAKNVYIQKLDITKGDDIEMLIQYIKSMQISGKFGKVLGLINNAGVLTYGEFDWQTWNQIQAQINVNFFGTVAVTRALLPFIIESRGSIVNITSVSNDVIMPGLSVYSATKAALASFSRVLGLEMSKFGVKTIVVKLGDFAKLTSIMSQHDNNAKTMWEKMDLKKRLVYKDYFHKFHNMAKSNSGATGPDTYDGSKLFEKIDDSIFLENPPNTIVIAPLKFRILYFIMALLPVNWIYFLYGMALHFGADLKIDIDERT